MSTAAVAYRAPQTSPPLATTSDDTRMFTEEKMEKLNGDSPFVSVLKTVFFFVLPLFALISYIAKQLSNCLCGSDKIEKDPPLPVDLELFASLVRREIKEDPSANIYSLFTRIFYVPRPAQDGPMIAMSRGDFVRFIRALNGEQLIMPPSTVTIEEMEDEEPQQAAPASRRIVVRRTVYDAGRANTIDGVTYEPNTLVTVKGKLHIQTPNPHITIPLKPKSFLGLLFG